MWPARVLAPPGYRPALLLLISVGVLGQLSTYIAGNSRLPFALGLDHYLPPAFAKVHPRWGTPYVSILMQGVFSTIFLVLAELGESLRAAYQIMVDMTVIVTLIPFVYIFASGMKFGQRWAGTTGAIVSAVAIVLSAIPPPGVASVWLFELKVVGGTLLLVVAGRMIFTRSQAAARMTYSESVRFLYSLGNEVQTAKFGLDRITRLLEAWATRIAPAASCTSPAPTGKGPPAP